MFYNETHAYSEKWNDDSLVARYSRYNVLVQYSLYRPKYIKYLLLNPIHVKVFMSIKIFGVWKALYFVAEGLKKTIDWQNFYFI